MAVPLCGTRSQSGFAEQSVSSVPTACPCTTAAPLQQSWFAEQTAGSIFGQGDSLARMLLCQEKDPGYTEHELACFLNSLDYCGNAAASWLVCAAPKMWRPLKERLCGAKC